MIGSLTWPSFHPPPPRAMIILGSGSSTAPRGDAHPKTRPKITSDFPLMVRHALPFCSGMGFRRALIFRHERRRAMRILVILLLTSPAVFSAAPVEAVLFDFEEEADLARWTPRA